MHAFGLGKMHRCFSLLLEWGERGEGIGIRGRD